MPDGCEVGGAPARSGIIDDIKALTTSAFAFRVSRPIDEKSLLEVSLAQPLRVENGDAVLTVPVGRTRSREVIRRTVSADLAPSGRQLDLSVHWERPLAGGLFRLGATATRHARHDAAAAPQITLLTGWHAGF